MNGLIVREAETRDESGIGEVGRMATAALRKVYRPTGVALRIGGTPHPDSGRLVAVSGGRVVGVVRYYPSDGALHLTGLGVHEAFRRQGIARALLDGLEAVAFRRNLRELALYTVRETGNVAIFRRLGFAVRSEVPTDLFESVEQGALHEVEMVRVVRREM